MHIHETPLWDSKAELQTFCFNLKSQSSDLYPEDKRDGSWNYVSEFLPFRQCASRENRAQGPELAEIVRFTPAAKARFYDAHPNTAPLKGTQPL